MKAKAKSPQPLPRQIHLLNGSKIEHVILSPMKSGSVYIGSDFHHSGAWECWDVETVQHNGDTIHVSTSWQRIPRQRLA